MPVKERHSTRDATSNSASFDQQYGPALALPTQRATIDRIVFRTGRGLGDAVLCEPLVRAIAGAYPNADLTVVLPQYCKGIHRLGFCGDQFAPWVENEAFTEFAADFDLAIDADPAQYAHPFHSVSASGTDTVYLFAHYRPEAMQMTAYQRLAEGLARIGIGALEETPTLHLPQAQINSTDQWREDFGIRKFFPLFVFHPGSSTGYTFKRWQPEGFAFVADELLARYDANVVFVGSGAEDTLIAQICALMKHGERVRVAHDWTLEQLARLLDIATLFVGNDSGVGHLAAALGRPTVTVAGPTNAHFWAPLTDRALVTDPQGCCYDPSTCGVRCLKSIRGGEVLGAVEALLSATTKREIYPCLDAIQVADNLEITELPGDGLVLRNRIWNMPLTVQRGRGYVLNVLDTVRASGSSRHIRQAFPDADPLLEQCYRHAILLPNYHTKENSRYVI